MDWDEYVDAMRSHVVRIETPEGQGTGFLIDRDDEAGTFGIATAAHVVRDAKTWGQLITIIHDACDEPCVIGSDDLILLHRKLDSACVVGTLPESWEDAFPREPVKHVPPERPVLAGSAVGWLGYPYLVPGQALCFFAGHVSAYVDGRYYIDGVAINGVSGGPAFFYGNSPDAPDEKRLWILGSISAYRANTAGGEVLPGLMVADDCTEWPGIFERADE